MTKLYTKDKKILSELEMNGRIPHSTLSKQVKVSKQVVKYRIERLEKENIIQGYNAIIDVNKLGNTIYLIYLKLIKLSIKEEMKWLKETNNNPNVALTAKNAGYWDLTIVVICRNNQELDLIFKEITKNKLNHIKDKLVTSEIESTYFNLKLLYKNTKNLEFNTLDTQKNLIIDDKDFEILNYLAKDCRISLLDLSKKLKTSPNGIKYKIRKLEKEKIILGYKTKINYEKLGFLHFRVFLHLNNFTNQLYSQIKQFLKNKGNIESLGRYVGYADIDFRCYCKDVIEFYKLISEIKDTFLQNIIEIDSMLIFNWESINYYPML